MMHCHVEVKPLKTVGVDPKLYCGFGKDGKEGKHGAKAVFNEHGFGKWGTAPSGTSSPPTTGTAQGTSIWMDRCNLNGKKFYQTPQRYAQPDTTVNP